MTSDVDLKHRTCWHIFDVYCGTSGCTAPVPEDRYCRYIDRQILHLLWKKSTIQIRCDVWCEQPQPLDQGRICRRQIWITRDWDLTYKKRFLLLDLMKHNWIPSGFDQKKIDWGLAVWTRPSCLQLTAGFCSVGHWRTPDNQLVQTQRLPTMTYMNCTSQPVSGEKIPNVKGKLMVWDAVSVFVRIFRTIV